MKRLIIFLVIFSFLPLVFAQQSYELKDIKVAIEGKIDRWCSKYPLEHVALNTLGYCYLQENNFEKVNIILEEKLKEGFVDDLEKFTTYTLLGISKTMLGDSKEAEDAFVQLRGLAQKLNGTEVYEIIDSLVEGIKNPPIDKSLIDRGKEQLSEFVDKKEDEINSEDIILAYAKGQYDGAIEQINSSAISSNSVAQHVYKGKIALTNSNFEGAIKPYNSSMTLGYAPADVYLDIAYAYNQLGRYEETVLVLTNFLKRDPLYGKSCALRLIAEAKEKLIIK